MIIESLNRLEAKLHGETPAITDIWNKWSGDVYRPIDENTFSNYVKRHLTDDLKTRGIIANREVEIHGGEKTDIHIDAVVFDSTGQAYDTISVIIETKGCWNKKLDTAMKTQLLDKYLANNHCNHGIYLIGWFNCEKWDDSHYQKKAAPNITLDEARQNFDAQAAELSKDDKNLRAYVMDTGIN